MGAHIHDRLPPNGLNNLQNLRGKILVAPDDFKADSTEVAKVVLARYGEQLCLAEREDSIYFFRLVGGVFGVCYNGLYAHAKE